MSNREDYLDSLLRSVTENEEEKEFISPEDDFLAEYDQELLDLDEDAFLQAFEKGLEGMDDLGDIPQSSGEAELDDILVDTMEQSGLDDMLVDTMEPDNENDMMVDTIGQSDGAAMQMRPADLEDSGDMLVNTMDEQDLSDLQSHDLDSMLMAAMGAEEEESPSAAMPETADIAEPTETDTSGQDDDEDVDDAELLEILAGLTPDEDLAEIETMLKAHDEDTLLENESFNDMPDELGQLDFPEEEEEDSGKKKKKKKKKDKKDKKNKEDKEDKGGFFKRFSNALFGENEEEFVDVPEEGSIENISDENMEILKELDGDSAKKQKKQEKLEKKKEKKEQKKQKKLEKKAQKEKQPKAPKPKKEKKPKAPAEKTKPLPKLPVFLIFLMVASILVLIFLGSSLTGYSVEMEQSRDAYDKGDYVQAYECLRGMKIKEVDKEFYDKTRLTAYLKQELNSYDGYISRSMYPEALDALILVIGKYDKFLADAQEVHAEDEFEEMKNLAEQSLSEVFQVAIEEAREVYRQRDRDIYTKQIYELLQRSGHAE